MLVKIAVLHFLRVMRGDKSGASIFRNFEGEISLSGNGLKLMLRYCKECILQSPAFLDPSLLNTASPRRCSMLLCIKCN